MICEKCGKELDDSSIVCNYCGKKIKNRSIKELKNINRSTLIIISSFIVAIIVFILALSLIIIPKNKLRNFESLLDLGKFQEACDEYNIISDSSSNNKRLNTYAKKYVCDSVNDMTLLLKNDPELNKSYIDDIIMLNKNFACISNIYFNNYFTVQLDRYLNELCDIDILVSDYNAVKNAGSVLIDEGVFVETYLYISDEYYNNDNYKDSIQVFIDTFINDIEDETLLSKLEVTKTLLDSRPSYYKAENEYKKDNFYQAFTHYQKVSNQDMLYYSVAVQKQYECQQKVIEIALEEIQQLMNEREYSKALVYASSREDCISYNAEVESLVNKCKSEYRFYSSKNAIEYVANKDYISAIDELTSMQIHVQDNQIAKKIQEYTAEYEEYKKERIVYLKGKVTIAYDDIDDNYKIVPKGYSTRYINIDKTINIEPGISYDGNPVLYCTLGFEQKDWVFFDEITFYYDGTKNEWSLDYFDRGSQVLWGGIAEWYTVAYNSTGIKLYTSFALKSDLLDIMKKLSNAQVSKIRFSGDGYRDHALTSSEKNNLKYFVELYEFLENNPELWDYIKP